jgi:hypothetical protein
VRECEAGNEKYLPGQVVIGNEPGNQGILTDGQIQSQIQPTKKKKKAKK